MIRAYLKLIRMGEYFTMDTLYIQRRKKIKDSSFPGRQACILFNIQSTYIHSYQGPRTILSYEDCSRCTEII